MLKKIVLITGATSGIGKATAKVFAKAGYDLILTGRRKDRLKQMKQRFVEKYAIKVQTLAFDIRDKQAVVKALKTLRPNWKNIDILINNAGLASGLAPIHEGNTDDWDIMLDTNVKGLLYISQIVSKGMVARKKGHIINIGSTAGQEVYRNGNVYCASKYAVKALTKAMRLDFYDKNIRVSQISPGAVEETEFSLVRFKGDKERAAIYNEFNPLKSRDVAKVIFFVASQPKHVNIQDVLFMGTQQASATLFDKSGRRFDS
ncbi:MAG: 3-hydroxy acid dehydrogenase/malonic semialdehyde reductase [Saprospiraceae bacterium]|jgi:3-hydroxy acid dehydrogenase/malonic semialdehyde reductase